MVLFLIFIPTEHNFYRPQRTWGKVIFSQASVILSRGGGLPGPRVGGGWSWGGLLSGGWSGPRGCLFWGCLVQGGLLPGGCLVWGVSGLGVNGGDPLYASYWNAFLWKMLTYRGYFRCLNGSVTKENSFVLYGN